MKTYLVIMVGILLLGTGTAHAVECQYNRPENAPIIYSFEQTVRTEYGGIPQSGRERSLIYGHALGRMEAAAGNDFSRVSDMACLKRKLENDFLSDALNNRLNGFDWPLAQQAAAGYHAVEVQRISGVINAGPLYKGFSPSGGGSYSAGPVAGGTVGGSGVRIQIREGSRPPPRRHVIPSLIVGGNTSDISPDSNTPNWNDLPNSETTNPRTGHFHRGFMMAPPLGVQNKNNWWSEGDYNACMVYAKNADNGDTKFARGLRKGTVQIMYHTNDKANGSQKNKFFCRSYPAPFENVYMKEMDERAEKQLAFCKRQYQNKWCKIWFMN